MRDITTAQQRTTRLQQIIEYRNEGLPWAQIGEKFAETTSAVYSFAIRNMPDTYRGAVLNQSQKSIIDIIRQLKVEGLSNSDISKKVNLTPQSVHYYVKRYLWDL
jgi:DNA-binding transcriptional MerR regulator